MLKKAGDACLHMYTQKHKCAHQHTRAQTQTTHTHTHILVHIHTQLNIKEVSGWCLEIVITTDAPKGDTFRVVQQVCGVGVWVWVGVWGWGCGCGCGGGGG